MRFPRPLLPLVVVLVAATACATDTPAPAPDPAALADLREAAAAGEDAWGVPADLTLAVAYAETRWRVPTEESHDGAGEGHAPRAVGIGGLRPWLDPDPVAIAERVLGVGAAQIDEDPVTGVLATAAVLRHLADRRGADPAADDPGAWLEVLGDLSGLDHPEARRSYAEDVLRWLREGVRTVAADGSVVELSPRTVTLPESVAARTAYSGAQYPGARWVPAHGSNYTSGRSGGSIRYVVIHTMQGSYAGSLSWFQNPSANVSAHYSVRSSDGEISQSVHEGDTGWHAGNWTYNQRSIGIEHEGYVSDPGRWYTDAMYRSSAALVRHLCDKYGIPVDRLHIIGHNEVPGATHTDPGGGWDWPRFMSLVRGEPERPNFDAEFVGKDHPTEMVSGERAVAWVEFRNTGSRTWSLDRTLIGTTGPRDHASPFYDAENWMNDHRASGADHSTYSTGTVGRFTFMVTAPEVTEETVITDTFGLVQEGVSWFGPEDVNFSITVRPPAGTEPPPSGPDDPPAADPPAEGAIIAAPAAAEPGTALSVGDGGDSTSGAMTGGCSATGRGARPPWAGALLLLLLWRRRRNAGA